MDIVNIVIMLLIGVFGGFISGLVGVGGAIIIYPAILLLHHYSEPLHIAHISHQVLLLAKSFSVH